MAPRVEDEHSTVAATANVSFDAELAIAGFLADASLASIELPRMLSSEQRKHAKKIVQQYADLKCESYGLGDDRQMHVFKNGLRGTQPNNSASERMSDCSPQSVSIKNTFIDDWVSSQGTTTHEQRIVQSMPHNMFTQSLTAEMHAHGTSTVEGSSGAIASAVTSARLVPAVPYVACESPFLLEADEAGRQAYALGTEVVIDGLVKAPQFNGAVGIIQSWDADSCRYEILLTFATPSGHRTAKVKAENLRRTMPAGPIAFGEL